MKQIANKNIGARLLNYWTTDCSVNLQAPVSMIDIAKFENKNNIILSVDFISYLKTANGFDQKNDLSYQDKNGFNFWPLNQMRRVSEYDDGRFSFLGCEDFFLFCDYLDFCWGYVIRFGSHQVDGEVCIVGTTSGFPFKVANSFSEFIDIYLEDNSRLYDAT